MNNVKAFDKHIQKVLTDPDLIELKNREDCDFDSTHQTSQYSQQRSIFKMMLSGGDKKEESVSPRVTDRGAKT